MSEVEASPGPGDTPTEARDVPEPSLTDAVVTPVAPEEIEAQSSEATVLAVAAAPEPSVKLYDPAPAREAMRKFISYAVLITTAIAGFAVILNAALGGENAQIVMGVFTAFVGLAGTILGFYFGGKDKTG